MTGPDDHAHDPSTFQPTLGDSSLGPSESGFHHIDLPEDEPQTQEAAPAPSKPSADTPPAGTAQRKKVALAVGAVAILALFFIVSTAHKRRQARPTTNAPQAFSRTATERRSEVPLFSMASQPQGGSGGVPVSSPGGPSSTMDPRVAALLRQTEILKAEATLRQAQYALAELRLPPSQTSNRTLSVDLSKPPDSSASGSSPSGGAGLGAAGARASTLYSTVTEAAPGDNPKPSALREGTLLDGVLVNKLVTDNYTSPVLVMIDRPYYDPITRKLLVPAGTRMLGKAEAVKFQSASRLAITFDLFQFPNGSTFAVSPDEQALDGLGIFGAADNVNRHTARILFTAGLVGILTGWNNSQTQTNNYGQMSGTDYMRYQASESLSRTGEQLLSPFLNAMPTITVNEGHRLKIWISRAIPMDYYQEGPHE